MHCNVPGFNRTQGNWHVCISTLTSKECVCCGWRCVAWQYINCQLIFPFLPTILRCHSFLFIHLFPAVPHTTLFLSVLLTPSHCSVSFCSSDFFPFSSPPLLSHQLPLSISLRFTTICFYFPFPPLRYPAALRLGPHSSGGGQFAVGLSSDIVHWLHHLSKEEEEKVTLTHTEPSPLFSPCLSLVMLLVNFL